MIVWRLSRQSADPEINERAERRAVRLIALSFFGIAVYVAYDAARKLLGLADEPQPSSIGLLITALSLLVMPALALALHIAYHVVLVGGCGQTLGKMALGITVIRRDDGGIPGYGRAALRCLGGFLSLASFGLGYMGIVFTEERRGLADLLAGTRVIEELPEPVVATSPQAVHLLGV